MEDYNDGCLWGMVSQDGTVRSVILRVHPCFFYRHSLNYYYLHTHNQCIQFPMDLSQPRYLKDIRFRKISWRMIKWLPIVGDDVFTYKADPEYHIPWERHLMFLESLMPQRV